MKKQIFLFAGALTALFLFSCKKENTGAPAGTGNTGSRIKSIAGNWGTSDFTYDASGRPTLVSYSNGSKTVYEYSPGHINQKAFNTAGVNTETYQYELNQDGVITKETRASSPSFNEIRIYNSEKQIVKKITNINGTTQVIDFFWSNGNCDSSRFTNNGNWSSTIIRTFYTDKPNTLGYDIYGTPYYGKDSKNLMKSEQYTYPDGSAINPTMVNYEWDAQGRVTKETRTQGGNIGISYYSYK